jgi:prepilin-type N-terminal cleavage/methylation domain-containing protein
MRNRQRGYTITELLVVVAIIALMSLFAVPQFASMYRSSVAKASLRDFTGALRKARQIAATQSERTRVRYTTGTGGRSFQIERGGTNLASPTWTVVQPVRSLDANSYFDTSSTTPLNGTMREIDFLPNGSAVDDVTGTMPSTLTSTNNTVIIRNKWKRLTYNQYTVAIGASGQLTVTASKWQ